MSNLRCGCVKMEQLKAGNGISLEPETGKQISYLLCKPFKSFNRLLDAVDVYKED